MTAECGGSDSYESSQLCFGPFSALTCHPQGKPAAVASAWGQAMRGAKMQLVSASWEAGPSASTAAGRQCGCNLARGSWVTDPRTRRGGRCGMLSCTKSGAVCCPALENPWKTPERGTEDCPRKSETKGSSKKRHEAQRLLPKHTVRLP